MTLALIIHDDSNVRQKLRRMLEEIDSRQKTPTYSEVKLYVEAAPALTDLSSSPAVKTIFIAGSLGRSAIARFIEEAKKIEAAKKAAFILLIGQKESNRQTISNAMMVGVHGFLCSPFSLAAVEEVSRLTAGVRMTDTKLRLRAATGLMISALLKQQEKVKATAEAELTGKKLDLWEETQACCDQYKVSTGESVTTAVVQDMLTKPISERAVCYDGVSRRVREIVAQKAMLPTEIFARLRKAFIK